jgi:hypothetical protein
VAKTAKVRIIQRFKDTVFYQKQSMSKRIISKTTMSRYFGNFWFRFPNLISSDKIKIKNNISLRLLKKKTENVPFYESFSVIEATNNVDRDKDDTSDG